MKGPAAVSVLVAVACGCNVPIGRFTAIGDPTLTAAVVANAPAERVTGRSCRCWILGITLGVPHIEEAVADALRDSGGTGLLLDADLVSVHPVWGPGGRHCYEITGTPWHPPRADVASSP